MWIYLLLAAGVFMGWSLGTNDAANAFGTAVGTGVVKYRTAVTIIASLVVLGAVLQGSGNLTSVNDMAVNNAVITTTEEAGAIIKEGGKEAGADLALKAGIKAAIIFTCAALTVFIMSYLKFPVSANQSITGAIIGWGLFHADYSDAAVRSTNLAQLGKFASTWLLNPLGAAIISFLIVTLYNKLLANRVSKLANYDKMIKIGYLVAGAFASYSIGINSSASVTALYYGPEVEGVKTNILSNAQLAATIGGIAIALGVLTYSKKVMMTVGNSIAPLTQVEGFLVILAMSATIVVMEKTMGIPVSTSQAVVGAVIGAGITKGVKNVNFGVFKNIGIAWISSPLAAGILTYLAAVATQGFLS